MTEAVRWTALIRAMGEAEAEIKSPTEKKGFGQALEIIRDHDWQRRRAAAAIAGFDLGERPR